MDWFCSGRVDSFRFVRVSLATWRELEEVAGITGGTLERNGQTALKASGSLDYVLAPAAGNDLVRVYSDSLDPATGERATIAHGTYLVSTPSSTFRGSVEEGTADLYSVLHVLEEDAFEAPLVLPAGTNAVARAADIVRGAGLPAVASPSAAVLSADAVFDERDASKLDVVNWLLDLAGFESAGCDGYGNVLLAPYVDPAAKSPTVVLHDDEGACVYRSGVVREYDAFDVPNVVTVTRSNASGEPLSATAVNDDPASAFSTVSRGRRIVRKETVSDAADLAALHAKARSLLAAKTAAVEGFEVTHAFLPFEMGAVCDFAYRKAGIARDDLMAVRQTMKLRPGMECTTRFLRFARR
ncbi:hypothetical protein [Arabiibacter massiliensis]|uniref:hypothetical protein n=1 Tax=Arabiibacter massiliensis TaxID=1870985 RepID=UPI00117A2E69|nr:hypothetical protein [Arabiibacter massiliensis]